MSGYVGDLSPAQEEALGKLRVNVADLPKPEDNDYFYLRWLRARKFNLRKAEEMLRKHLQFRKDAGIDTILQDWTPPEALQKCFPGGFFGEDRDGHPVYYDNIGNLDFRGLFRCAKREDLMKVNYQILEKVVQALREFSEKKGKYIETITVIVDCENLSMQKHILFWPGVELMRQIFSHVEQNYPEIVKQVFVVKAPAVFPLAYNLVKAFMDEKTRRKVVLLKDDWQMELRKYIAPDQLPLAYGGTRCEPDPDCTDYINHGCDVPPEYYLTNLTETSRDEMERAVVGRRSSHKVQYQIDKPRSTIRWEFISIDHDIGFGVYNLQGEKKQELVPMKRRSSHVIPENGFHTCETDGTYVLKFDNSYSWTRAKEILYTVKILHPNSEVTVSPGDSDIVDEEFFDCSEDIPQASGLVSSDLHADT